jgi:pimeloyl-ACP methyl ester carboxylesterase
MMRVVFVHGACVKDGSWWWHRTGELLAERGVASEAPALPSCGETGEPTGAQGPGLAEDVASVRQVLTASDEPTVVVAHSYGGIVTAEAAAGVGAVRHLLAALAHGAPIRATFDVDLTPARDPENLARLSDSLRDLDARIRTADVDGGLCDGSLSI